MQPISNAIKTVFGGSDDSAQRGQIDQNRHMDRQMQANMEQARQDAFKLYPAADANRNMGFQSTLDLLGQSAPAQIDAFQQGNVGAQNAVLAGLPQIQNALMGHQVNMSQFQPQQFTPDMSFLQQQLPEFISSIGAMSAPSLEDQITAENLPNVLAGITSNEDLFTLASQGDIPDISKSDQRWFGNLISDMRKSGNADLGGTRFIDDPMGQLAGFVGMKGGLTSRNEGRLENLLNQFADMQSSAGGQP